MKATVESGIATAFDRIDDFLSVQGQQLSSEAVDLLQRSVGIEEETRAVIADRLELFDAEDGSGPVLLGVIVGLLAAQLHAECGGASTPN